MFSDLLLSRELLWGIHSVCVPRGLPQVLAVLYSCSSSIQLSCYIFSIPISCTKTLFFPLHPFHGMSPHILHKLVGRIFFRYFGSPVLFVLLDPISVTFECLFFYLFLLGLSAMVFFFFLFALFHYSFCVHFLPNYFRLFTQFLYLSYFILI